MNSIKNLILISILCLLMNNTTKAQSQKIELLRDDLEFTIEVVNPKIYRNNDSLEIKYSVSNSTISKIAIFDTKIKGLPPENPLEFNQSFTILQMDLGGLLVIYEFNYFHKYRVLEPNKIYSDFFKFPVSTIIQNLNRKKVEANQKRTKKSYIEVPIEIYITYSNDKEIVDGKFSEILNFNEYVGYLDNLNAFDLLQYLQFIEISGLYARIMVSD